jgi:hypothetical protein
MKPILPVRSSEVVARRIAGELFLVPIRGQLADLHGIYALNPVGAFIWERLDGRSDAGEIAKAISKSFEVELDTARADAEELVAKLQELGFLEVSA